MADEIRHQEEHRHRDSPNHHHHRHHQHHDDDDEQEDDDDQRHDHSHRHHHHRHHHRHHHDKHHHSQQHQHEHHHSQQLHPHGETDSPKRTVIIAMDGSRHSFYAFDWYMGHIHTLDTEVIVAHSSGHHSKPFSHVQNLMPSVITADAVMSRMAHEEEEVNKIVAQIKGKFSLAGVRGKVLRLSGEPGAAIVHAANEHKACCIVTGSRGLGTVRRTLIGSVSDYILHHANCPVLVCRHKEHKEHKDRKNSG